MKFKVLLPLIPLIIILSVLFINQIAVSATTSKQQASEEASNSFLGADEKLQKEAIEAKADFENSLSSETSSVQAKEPDDKQESQNGIEHSIKFVSVDSELHQKLLKELRKNIPDETLNNKKNYDFGVDLDGGIYSAYKSDVGFEFYEENIEWHEQFEGVDDHFRKWIELQEQELEKLDEWNAKNESIIYQLVNEFNYLSVEKYNLPNISPVNVDCRGNICSVHFSHPTNFFNKSGEEIFAEDLKAVLAFRQFFMEKRSLCKCRGFEYFSDGWNESSFRFVFD